MEKEQLEPSSKLEEVPEEEDAPFVSLSDNARELYLGSEIERVSIASVSPLSFYRNYVSLNKPVVITGALEGWPALKKWTNTYLKSTLGDLSVTVDVTPNGYGDAVVDDKYFVQPEKRSVKFSQFVDIIENPRKQQGIFYIMHQNSNFGTEFSALWKDIDEELAWASEAFGSKPDAVNFWMGEDRSVSSLHKDHYENMYGVVAGEKIFALLPPTDYHFLHESTFLSARYHQNSTGSFDIIPDDPPSSVPWIPVDPENIDEKKFPKSKHVKPYIVSVKAGELLYLPSLWFHKVMQKGDSQGRTIAVNYWYDMQYDIRYNYYGFMEAKSKSIHTNKRGTANFLE